MPLFIPQQYITVSSFGAVANGVTDDIMGIWASNASGSARVTEFT